MIYTDVVATRLDLVLHGIFYLLLLAFTLHTLVLTYHWFTYGKNRNVAMLALAIYLLGGAASFLAMSALLI